MVTILLWAIVGGLAGLIFGVTAGLPERIIAFVILLGAGSAAVPLIEHELRQKRMKNVKTTLPVVKPVRVDAPPAFAKASAGAAPHPLLIKERGKLAEGVLSPDEARQWLDEFLLKQQAK